MNLHDRPLIEQMAVTYAAEIERLNAEIARLRELKTPATQILLNLTKALLDAANAEIERLRAALEQALENIANKRVPRQNIGGPIRAALANEHKS